MAQIWRMINGLQSSDSDLLEITRSTAGIMLNPKRQIASLTVPVQVVSGGPGQDYVADVYGDGDSEAATETAVDLRILQLAPSETLPVGTWLLASKIGDVYYGQVAIWL